MFNWRRPQDMPVTEPTEEQIWEIIEAYDPHYSSSIQDRLSWHQEMLEDRNIYGDIFARSSRMTVFDSEFPSEYNPTNWIVSLKLRHTYDAPLEKFSDRLVYGTQEVLQPAGDSPKSPGVVQVLSYYILHKRAEDWEPKSVFGTPLGAVNGYADWARYHLQMHHKVLKRAGVYHAIYASLFDYSRLPFAWIRGIAECWDKNTNTCWFGPHEMTITLADIQDITGLPVLGTPYEECIPPDHELFKRQKVEGQRRGGFVYSRSLHHALNHYQKFFEDKRGNRRNHGTITLNSWSESFLRRSKDLSQYARLNDPFDLGSEASETSLKKRYEPEEGANIRNILIHGMDEDVSLVAFIATWLCYFVFPTRKKIFRPSALLMASLIARGERVALAPAALAYLYHGLGRVGALAKTRRYDVEAPWHYLHGWVYEHISGSFSRIETPQYFLEQRYPIIMQLSGATSTVKTVQIRTFMFAPSHMTDRFLIEHQSQFQNVHDQDINRLLEDAMTENNTPLLLSKQSHRSSAEYLVGIRPSWLCYRRQESVILEGYNPNRVARQYGFCQATPIYGLPPICDIDDTQAMGKLPLAIRLKAASESWAFLFRFGTGSRFYIAPRHAVTGISHTWLAWIRRTYSSYLDMGFHIYGDKLRNPRHIRHSLPAKEMVDDESNKRKRNKESLSAHADHEVQHREQVFKRKRGASPSIYQNPSQSEPLRRSGESEPDINIHSSSSIYIDKTRTDIRGSLSPSNSHDIVQELAQDEPLSRSRESEAENAIQEELHSRSRESEAENAIQEKLHSRSRESEAENAIQEELHSRSRESESGVSMHKSSPIDEAMIDRRSSISPSNPHNTAQEIVQNEPLPRSEGLEPDDVLQNESLPQSKESETDMNMPDCLPTHVSEASTDMRSTASSSTHQNMAQNESLPSYEELQMPENMQNPHPNCHEEAIASTSVAARSSPHESENISRMSEEADTVSPIHYSDKSDTNNSLEGFDANPTGEGSFLSDSVQQGNANIVEELVMESIVETEEHSSHTADILEPLSGLEMTSFISEIRTRTANPSRGRFSRSLGNIMTTLRELILEINIEELPEIKEFRDMANSLLNCAVISGIDAQELQLWESTLRDIEFGIFSIQSAREERSLEEIEAVEAAYKDIFERATPARENLQRKLKNYKACQKQIMWASAEVVRFNMELEKLQQRKRYLIQEREIVSQNIVDMETDFAQMGVEISELEQISTPLSQQLEIASQHRQTIKDQHGHKAAEARTSIARIREIQSKYA